MGLSVKKKQKNDEKEGLKSKELMSKFLYSKTKTDDAESESESEDDSILKHTESESEDGSRDEGSYQLFAENEDSMDQGGEDTRDPDLNNDSDGKNEEMVEEKKKSTYPKYAIISNIIRSNKICGH